MTLDRGKQGSQIGGVDFSGADYLEATLSPAIVAANTTAEQLFTVEELPTASSIVAIVNKPTAQAGLGIVGARVVSTTQIGITFSNNTGVGITPTAGEVYRIMVLYA